MELTKEYLAEQEKCIKENFESYKENVREINTKIRLTTSKLFCQNAKTILSVGCGGFEPIYLDATHACDVHKSAREILKSQNWKGEFDVCSCDNLPYENKSFDVAVCSEVIEHLPSLEMVKNTFLELDRVSKSWIVTTPNADICKKENQYKGHLQFWNKKDLKNIIPSKILSRIKIYSQGLFIFIKSPKQ